MRKLTPLFALTLAAALAACGTQPGPASLPAAIGGGGGGVSGSTDGETYPAGNPYRLLQAEELPIVGVTTDSELANHPKAALRDGNLNTDWSSGVYRAATAWAAVELAQAASLSSVAVKTGPTAAGTSYDVQVSADGQAWQTVAANQTNAGWGLETKALPAGTTGKFVRLLWHNAASNPQARFTVFELVVNGAPGPVTPGSPTPTATPTSTPTTAPTTAPSTGPAAKLAPAAVAASSTYGGLAPQRALDGNGDTQWSNGGYREPEAWLRLDFGHRVTVGSVRLKTGALPAGVSYRIEVSDDGNAWTAASGPLTNTTWNMETKAVSGAGRFLRVRFTNAASSPLARFSVFEIEAWSGSGGGGNQAPAIGTITQDKLKNPDHLSATASDPDGDALTFTWRRADGTVFGTGATVSYTPAPGAGGSYDETVTLTVTDGRGGEATRSYVVDNMGGMERPLPANDPMAWDAGKAAHVAVAGDVTVLATGDFTAYGAVIVEYTTANGRRLALAEPDVPTSLPGVTGHVYMYLLGPGGPDAVQPDIQASVSGGGQTATRAITIANVAGSHHQGQEQFLGSGDPETLAGESDAKNGPHPYGEALLIQSSGYLSYADYGLTREEGEANGLVLDGVIGYRLIRTGDRFWGADHRLAYGDFGVWLGFTDTTGGAGDNTGSMTLYEPYEE